MSNQVIQNSHIPSNKQDRIIICMKWGSVFSSDYVNVLYRACCKNLNQPFRFICLTDNATDLFDGIETLPIPDIGCTPEMWRHGAWPKLAVFAEHIGGLNAGRILFIDLDTVICGDLEPFFSHPAEFIGIDTGDNWRPGRHPGGNGALLGTGVFAFDLGTQVQILQKFQENPKKAFIEADIEQVWVQKHAREIDYWPQGWVVSFKRWLRQPIGLDLFKQPKKPPNSAGMVAFHGDPRPAALLATDGKRWDRFPHQGRGQVTWMAEYWLSHGGHLPNSQNG
jgi:hypothetical protein